jgi:hypothetical protein
MLVLPVHFGICQSTSDGSHILSFGTPFGNSPVAFSKGCHNISKDRQVSPFFDKKQSLDFHPLKGITVIIMPDSSSKTSSVSKVDENSMKDGSDHFHDSTSGLSTSTSGKKEDNKDQEMAETRYLSRSRITVLVILTAVAAIAGALTFVVSTEEEEEDFESRVRSERF